MVLEWLLIALSIKTCWAGLACIRNPCVYGICIESTNSFVTSSYTCYCIDGFTGANCQTNWDECWSSPCQNGGTCHDGIAYFNCTCPEGFIGETCSDNINECGSNPCLNNGTCVDVDNGYSCQCQAGYLGYNCEMDMAVCNTTEETKCANGGACVEGPGITFSCRCLPGWTGRLCEIPVDECSSSPCSNGGVCIDMHAMYVCACPYGYTGMNCETQVELCATNTCENNALCVVEGRNSVCYCVPDYHGDRCQMRYDECQKGPGCLNGGTCIDGVDSYTCTCTPSFTGRFCECQIDNGGGLNCNYLYTMIANFTEVPSVTIPLDFSTRYTYRYSTETSTEITVPTEYKQTELSHFTFTPERSSVSVSISNTWETAPGSDYSFTESQSTTTSYTYSNISYELTTDFKSQTQEEQTEITDFTTGLDFTQTEDYSKLWTTHYTTDQYETTQITDCSICQNGAKCATSSQGTKCHCTFGWKGKYCDEDVGIKIAAFQERSYLIHTFLNTSKTSISFKLRTLANTGIILYTYLSSTTYMALYLQQGFLIFQFSCGIQTMLFSELKYPINNGYEMEIETMLEREHKGAMLKYCNGTVRINGTLSMSGKQEILLSSFGEHSSGALYLGGLEYRLINEVDLPLKTGITACMHALKINGIDRDIYGSALDGVDISECESLACLSNPCQNSATCIEIGQKWNCLCSSGYLGITCERSICLNNPCKFGGTCVPYPGSGFLCLCPLAKHGMFCDQDLEIGHPYFSSSVQGLSSYTAYPLPGAIHHSFDLHYRFIPSSLDQISLMIFIGQKHQHDSSSDHLAVSFIKGYVVLTWNLGSGPRRIFTPKPIVDSGKGKDIHTIRLGRTGQHGWLQVDNMPNVTGTSPGWLTQLNTRPVIYIGGHESKNFTALPHDLPLHTGFSGCIFDVELRAGKVRLMIQRSRDAVGRNVGQCSTKHCNNATCLHGGACIDHGATYTCICPDGWFGAGCAIRYNPCDSSRHNCSEGSTCVPLGMSYECDCPLGKTGKFCHKDETLSDVGFSGHRSFLSLPPAALDLTETCVDFEIRPVSSHGIILFSSQKHGLSESFISLSLHGGVLELRLLPIGGRRRSEDILVVRSGQIVPLGQWSRVRAGRYGRRIFLWVSGLTNAGSLLPGEILLPSHTPLFIGGLPDLSNLPSNAVAGLPVSFSGCVRKLWINWRSVPLDQRHIISARNIQDCDGTACGGDVCLNGGSCWLTPENRPSCTCLQQYNGDRCENQVSCSEVGCENNGKCVTQGKNKICNCPVGWTGSFCQTEIDSSAPHFDGNSYLLIEMVESHEVSKREEKVKTINSSLFNFYMNFSTAQHDGMLLWTLKDDKFLGIGLETGLMKIVWGEALNKKEVLLPGAAVADGAWHNLAISLTGNQLNFWIDRAVAHTLVSDIKIETDGILYLGGFPDDKKVIEETKGNFFLKFNGCVKEISWNNFSIADFSTFKGENLKSCDMVYS